MRLTLIIIFAVVIIDNCISQNHMVYENSEWYYSNPNYAGNPMADFTYYKYTKDTVINEENCKFIHSSAGDHIIFLEKSDKVFYYKNERFYLLYDFNAAVDDTLYLDMWVNTFLLDEDTNFILIDTIIPVKSIVTNIDSLQVDEYYLKEIFVNIFPEGDFLEHATWPSGISYTEYIGDPVDGPIPFAINGSAIAVYANRNLRCYSDSRFAYTYDFWQQFNVDCDYKLPPVTNESEVETANLEIYPNPVLDELTILPAEYAIKDYSFELFDLMGGCLIPLELNMYNSSVSLGELSPGLYILVIKNERNQLIQTFKVLKQ